MDITYGMDIKSHEDQFLQAVELAMQYAERAVVPGAFLVDTIPIRMSATSRFCTRLILLTTKSNTCRSGSLVRGSRLWQGKRRHSFVWLLMARSRA
jgi:hypothetical protein